MQDSKRRKISEEDQMIPLPEKDIDILRLEVENLKRSKREFFSRLSEVSKSVSAVSKQLQKAEKKNRSLMKEKTKIENDLLHVKAQFYIETQLKNEYKRTIDSFEDFVSTQDEEIMQLHVEKEDLISLKDNLYSRISNLDETRVANLEAENLNFQETKNIIQNGNLQHHVNGVVTGLKELLTSIDSESNEDAGVGSCIVCRERAPKYAFTPCGHLCVCHSCYSTGLSECPYCREVVVGGLRVFTV